MSCYYPNLPNFGISHLSLERVNLLITSFTLITDVYDIIYIHFQYIYISQTLLCCHFLIFETELFVFRFDLSAKVFHVWCWPPCSPDQKTRPL